MSYLGEQYIEELDPKFSYLFELKDNLYPIPMFGVETQIGWKSIIDEFLDKLIILDPKKELRIFQIKEKFGALRLYVNTSDKAVNALIQEYEEMSSGICEVCGNPGQLLVKSSWYKTRCEKHSEGATIVKK